MKQIWILTKDYYFHVYNKGRPLSEKELNKIIKEAYNNRIKEDLEFIKELPNGIYEIRIGNALFLCCNKEFLAEIDEAFKNHIKQL